MQINFNAETLRLLSRRFIYFAAVNAELYNVCKHVNNIPTVQIYSIRYMVFFDYDNNCLNNMIEIIYEIYFFIYKSTIEGPEGHQCCWILKNNIYTAQRNRKKAKMIYTSARPTTSVIIMPIRRYAKNLPFFEKLFLFCHCTRTPTAVKPVQNQ